MGAWRRHGDDVATRRFWLWLAVISGLALAIRLWDVFALEYPAHPGGDPYQYHYGANLLVAGKGFIAAVPYQVLNQVRQTAQHPPLYTLALAVPSVLGMTSFLDHQLWSVVIGVATGVLIGLVGRRLAGPRAGLIAAGLAALYPNLWIFDGKVQSETLSLCMTALSLLAAYRFWGRPTSPRAAALGLACGLAALTRSEAVLLLPLIVLPPLIAWRHLSPRRRMRLGAAAVVAAGAVISPWAIFNTWRFHHPEILSSGFGLAMVQGNCDATYYGSTVGYYSEGCIPVSVGDESDDDAYDRSAALRYARQDLLRVPFVIFTRVGRTWGFYRPVQQVKLDSYIEGRDFTVARAGLYFYFALLAASIPGLLVLRKRRVPISPLLATGLTATAAAAITFGQTRYRVSAEVALVLLAAVALDAAWQRQSGSSAVSGGDQLPKNEGVEARLGGSGQVDGHAPHGAATDVEEGGPDAPSGLD